MANQDLIDHLIARLGQSQGERLPAELDTAYALVDERDPDALWRFISEELAGHVSYAGGQDSDTWSRLFEDPQGAPFTEEQLAALSAAGELPPHLGLLRAFTQLYQHPREVLNRFTERHLEFYYRDILRFEASPPRPDRVHGVVELKKGVSEAMIAPSQRVSAGKGPDGHERLYAPVRETLARNASVAELRAVFRDADDDDFIRVAPAANSKDGQGEALDESAPAWSGFGSRALPRCPTGFALAGEVLRFAPAAKRTVRVILTLAQGKELPERWTSASSGFTAQLTGEAGWLQVTAVQATLKAQGGPVTTHRLTLEMAVPEGAVVAHDPALHGAGFAPGVPTLAIRLDHTKDGLTPALFEGAGLVRAQLVVEVEGLPPEALSNDGGGLDPKKAVQPFGPRPDSKARFHVHSREALAKRLSLLELQLSWMNVPSADMKSYYGAYDYLYGPFQVDAAFQGVSDPSPLRRRLALFAALATQAATLKLLPQTPDPAPSRSATLIVDEALVAGRGPRRAAARRPSSQLRDADTKLSLAKPLFSAVPTTAATEGAITLELVQGFGHGIYQRLLVAAITLYATEKKTLAALGGKTPTDGPVLPNEPYTPTLRGLSIRYHAQAEAAGLSESVADAEELRFFHLGPFGHRREHAALQRGRPWAPQGRLPLLPTPTPAGQLLIGLTGVGPGDSVSLLFHVSEGSADPELVGAKVSWAVLCDGHWKPLLPDELSLDTSNGLLRSGLVHVALPRETATEHSWMPSGRVWVQASLTAPPAAVCELIHVATNGVELRLLEPERSPLHLLTPLPAGSLKGFKPAPGGVKKLHQPYASFDGAPAEDPTALRVRAAERLRHRDRAVTIWDYERLILGAFPSVHRVKCLPHSRPGGWRAPGHVTLVLIPDLRNQNARDPLKPKVPADTLDQVKDLLAGKAGMGVRLHVVNPSYEVVKLSLGVRFYPGKDFNHYRGELDRALVRALAPWAFDPSAELQFGAEAYRSQLLQLVEDLDYVDYVTNFKLSFADQEGADAHVLRPSSPSAVLVSAPSHEILEAPKTPGSNRS